MNKINYPKYVWIVLPKVFNGCIDLRRYAFSYEQAVAQLSHCKKSRKGYRDCAGMGIWTLFKLVRVNKRGRPNPKGD